MYCKVRQSQVETDYLWEEEARNPESWRNALVDPGGQEVQALQEIFEPGTQWLQGRVRGCHPARGNPAEIDGKKRIW